ncbi:iron chelate uptake ABC transporter family permease subunit, partial [Paenibacillus sepulcri]|nr:iron chelate uptake ABC transporter family permease subunit [Paenibacillus sepulcri]
MTNSTTSPQKTADTTETKIRTRPLAASVILIAGIVALAFSLAVSVSVGAADIKLATVWNAIFHFNPDLTPHQIIQELRLPRAIMGAMVGACF